MKLKHSLILSILVAVLHSVNSQSIPNKFINPIISGFHPDPSIVRVEDDYYLVNSSFEWFPGIPIFHSKDMVNWEQLGYVLDRPEQLNMEGNRASSGIWAPTIRYHDGVFYVSVTCKQCKNDCNCGDNFFVTAKNPSGPWSDPVWVDGSEHSIDPTLYFEDGKVWYLGNRHKFEGQKFSGEHQIFIQELNIASGKLLGEPTVLTTGHAVNAFAAEGPHIFKIKNQYLLLISEGGTWQNHAITTFTSENLLGPYEATKVNPVITHRHLGENYPITTIGHADLVEDQNGQWWSVLLGVRPMDGYNILGRETFLTPVSFEGILPVFNPGIGKVLKEDYRPQLKWTPYDSKPARDEFNGDFLSVDWNFLRTPQTRFYTLENGKLNLRANKEKLTEQVNPSLIARRIENYSYVAATKLSFSPKSEEAGLVLVQNDRFHYRLVVSSNKSGKVVRLYKAFDNQRKELNEVLVSEKPYKSDQIILKVEQRRMNLHFTYGPNENDLINIGGIQDTRVISSNKAGGFIGPYVGLYASGNGIDSKKIAAFDWFEYQSLEDEIFEEKDGYLIVEAENYSYQSDDTFRHWYAINTHNETQIKDKMDSTHLAQASGGSYIELLPDTRRTHDDKLIERLNFSGKPGISGLINYRVKINTPGKYYVWVRAYSTGSEDNGIHVGIDGDWPDSGQRMQWCKGKNQWTWESKQRTQEQHCGVSELIYLDIDEPGDHVISFSMREDGFEMDAWAISLDYQVFDN